MKNYYLKTMNAQIYENTLYFISSELNLVFKYSLEDDSISFLNPPKENLMEKSLYGSIEIIDSEVYLIPFCANHLWIFCKNDKWEEVVLPDKSQKRPFFMGTVKYGDFLYILGYDKAKILRLDIKNNKFDSLVIDIDCDIDIETGCFGYDYEVVNDKIYLPVMCSNSIIEIDCNNDNIKIIDVPSCCHGYAGIAYDGKGFWLAPRRGQRFVFYSLDGEIKEYDLPKEYEKEKLYFGGAFIEGDKILFTSFCGKNLEFNRLYPEKTNVQEPSFYYYKILQNGGKVICECDGKTFYIDPFGKKRELNLLINEQLKLKYIKNNLVENYILTESNVMNLNGFIEMLNI